MPSPPVVEAAPEVGQARFFFQESLMHADDDGPDQSQATAETVMRYHLCWKHRDLDGVMAHDRLGRSLALIRAVIIGVHKRLLEKEPSLPNFRRCFNNQW